MLIIAEIIHEYKLSINIGKGGDKGISLLLYLGTCYSLRFHLSTSQKVGSASNMALTCFPSGGPRPKSMSGDE